MEQILRDYGIWSVVVLTILVNIKPILAFLSRGLSGILPTVAERERSRIERAKLAEQAQQTERMDAILMLKDLLIQYRMELDDAKTARHRAEAETLTVVRGYEKLSAQVVEVLRDIAETIRALTARLDKQEFERGSRRSPVNTTND